MRRAALAAGGVFRRAPLGVLVLGVLLGLLGLGLVAGALYLLLAGRPPGWTGAVAAGVLGPLCLYVAVHLIRLSRWAWVALTALFALLLLSSAARAATSQSTPISPMGEMGVEVIVLAYLLRGPVRRAFAAR